MAKYRFQLGEGVEEVASATGISPARIIAVEKGEQEPTGDEVFIIADHFRCDFKFFLYDERLAPFEQTTTLYRAHGTDFTKGDRRVVQEFLYLCETKAFLMKMLERPAREFSPSSKGNSAKKDGAEAAADLRKFLGYCC